MYGKNRFLVFNGYTTHIHCTFEEHIWRLCCVAMQIRMLILAISLSDVANSWADMVKSLYIRHMFSSQWISVRSMKRFHWVKGMLRREHDFFVPFLRNHEQINLKIWVKVRNRHDTPTSVPNTKGFLSSSGRKSMERTRFRLQTDGQGV